MTNLTGLHYKKLIEHIWLRAMLLAYNSTWSLRCLYLNIRWCSLAPSQLISCASIACVLDVRCISFNYCLINMDAFQVFVLVQELQQCTHDDGLVWIISIPIKCNDSVKNTGASTLTHTHRLPCKYCQYVLKKCRNLNGSTELNVDHTKIDSMHEKNSLWLLAWKGKHWVKHLPHCGHAVV